MPTERDNYHAVDWALKEAEEALEKILTKNNNDPSPLSWVQEKEVENWRSRIGEWRLSIEFHMEEMGE